LSEHLSGTRIDFANQFGAMTGLRQAKFDPADSSKQSDGS
jgi:hypothetical protein